MHQPSPYDPGTPRPHQQPDDDLGLDEAEEPRLGSPVYEGTGLSVRALTAEELDRFLAAHADQPARLLGSGWDARQPTQAPLRGSSDPTGPVATGWRPSLAGQRLAPRGGYGSPGHSAMLRYRRQRARELAGWLPSVGWRAAAVVAAGMLAALLAQAAGLHQHLLPVGLAAGMLVGWRLRFRVSHDARAWRRGARGERATARRLRRLPRRGYAVFHDVGIPGTPANADHLVVGPPGVVLVDSKRYTGQVTQTADGRVWHNHYQMDQQLRTLRLETEAISRALGVRARPVMCVHRAQVAYGGLQAGQVAIVPAGRLRGMLRHSGRRLGEADVAALVAPRPGGAAAGRLSLGHGATVWTGVHEAPAGCGRRPAAVMLAGAL